MQNFCDNLTRAEISNALVGARELLSILKIREGRSILDVVKTADKEFHNLIEINGESFEEIVDGKIRTYKGEIDPEDVEWIRVEEFNRGKRGDLMYCYISTDAHYDKDKKMSKATHFVPSTLVFDFYPFPETDENLDSITIGECEAILRGEKEIPK